MKLYNSLTKKIDEVYFQPGEELGFYACGFTVYDYAHLGHLRRYTMDDVLLRTLKHAGFKVKFVQNITDVGHLTSDSDTGEDKLEKGAKKYQTSVWDLVKKFTDYFFYSMDLMGNLRPDVSCAATSHISEQIELIKKLELKGFTYLIKNDGIYFDTSKLDDYGAIAQLDLENLQTEARVEKVAGKRNPTDFALWKFEREGENRAMVWESPWAKRGFPGWHIECSAMSMKYLGEQFALHTGGKDHLTIHHPNEIAQSEAATGKKPFVKHWVHHNFIQIEGEKMSKSLNNFFTIDEVRARGFHPRALRLLFLTTHYRTEQNFTWTSLAGAQKSYEKLIKLMLELEGGKEKTAESDKLILETQQVKRAKDLGGDKDKDENFLALAQFQKRFFDFLENDLKTPEALAVLWEASKAALPAPSKRELLIKFDQVLGLGLAQAAKIAAELEKNGRIAREIDQAELSVEVQKILHQRQQARAEQAWSLADQLRDKLQKIGLVVKDTTSGQKVYNSQKS